MLEVCYWVAILITFVELTLFLLKIKATKGAHELNACWETQRSTCPITKISRIINPVHVKYYVHLKSRFRNTTFGTCFLEKKIWTSLKSQNLSDFRADYRLKFCLTWYFNGPHRTDFALDVIQLFSMLATTSLVMTHYTDNGLHESGVQYTYWLTRVFLSLRSYFWNKAYTIWLPNYCRLKSDNYECWNLPLTVGSSN